MPAASRWRALILALGVALCADTRAHTPASALDVSRLHFAVVRSATGITAHTPPQYVFLETAVAARSPRRWSATAPRDWLEVTPASGMTPARLAVAVRPERAPSAAERARVLVSVEEDGSTSQHALDVTLTVLADRSTPPIGAFEAPADAAIVRASRTPLSGWALDDVAVAAIQICAERHPGDGETRCADGSTALIGYARVAAGPRPDVAAAFPSAPMNERSSWSYLLDQAAIARRGTLRLVAIAIDGENQAARIGARAVTLLPPDAPPGSARGPLLLAALGTVFFLVHVAVRRRLSALVLPPPSVETDGSGRVGAGEGVLLAAALAVSASFNLWGITRGFSYDELYSASHFVVDAPLTRTATDLTVFTNHILYSLLAAVCTRLLGSAEWVIRLPAVVFGTAAVFAVWIFTRRIAGAAAAVAAAWALACSPFFVEWARSARGYSLLGFLAVVSTHVFFRALRTGSTRAAAWHAPVTLLSLYVHLYGGWVLLAQYATYLASVVWRRRYPGGRALWWSFSAIGAGAVVMFLPLVNDMVTMIVVRGRVSRMPGFPFELLRAYAGVSSPLLLVWIALLAAAGLWRLRRRLESYYLFALIAVPLLIVWAFVTPRNIYPRYFSYWAPFFSVLIAVGADALARRATLRVAPGSRQTGLRALVTAIVLIPGAIAWVQRDLAEVERGGYRALLRFQDGRAPRVAAAGAEAEMFDYYLGKPLRMLHAPEELDRALREPGPLAVAYHDVAFNRAPQKAVEAMLRRRCVAEDASPVTRFYCNAAPPP